MKRFLVNTKEILLEILQTKKKKVTAAPTSSSGLSSVTTVDITVAPFNCLNCVKF